MKQTLIIAVVCFLAGAGIAKYYWPTVQTKVETQEKEILRTDVRTVTRIVERPNGVKETVTETVDKSVQKTDKNTTVTVNKEHNWMLGLGARSEFKRFGPTYELQITRRIVGPFFAGLSASTDPSLGLVIQMEF